MNLNALDYGLLLVIGFFTLVGGSRGLVRQLFDLAAWALSLYLAFLLGPAAARELNRIFALEAYLNQALGPLWGDFNLGASAVNALGFIAVLIVVKLVVELVANMADLLAKLPIIGTFNRVGGLAFGLAKGVVIVFVVSILLTALPMGGFETHVANSRLVDAVLNLSPALTAEIRGIIADVRP
ncbi:MAG: CvpA family protein [Selenomonadales bacterium]|nr:CvpA family protein [Selenomonadales bacterium]